MHCLGTVAGIKFLLLKHMQESTVFQELKDQGRYGHGCICTNLGTCSF